jgi:hypothetical protein
MVQSRLPQLHNLRRRLSSLLVSRILQQGSQNRRSPTRRRNCANKRLLKLRVSMLRPLRLQHLQYLQLPSMSPRWLMLPGCLAMAANMVSTLPPHFNFHLHPTTTLYTIPKLRLSLLTSPPRILTIHIILTEHLTVPSMNMCHHPLAALHRPPQGLRRLRRHRLTRGSSSPHLRLDHRSPWICLNRRTDQHQVKRSRVKNIRTAFHEGRGEEIETVNSQDQSKPGKPITCETTTNRPKAEPSKPTACKTTTNRPKAKRTGPQTGFEEPQSGI